MTDSIDTIAQHTRPAVTDRHHSTGPGNRLLAMLTPGDRAALLRHAERERLVRGAVLTHAHTAMTHAFFIEDGIVSVVKPQDGERRTELCLVGSDSFVGTPLVLADGRWPYETFAQTDVLVVVRVAADDLIALLARSEGARRIINTAIHVQTVQIGEALVSASWQRISVRLARWLLMYRDRLRSDTIDVTHEFMALMIGAQRTRVTGALHELEGAGAIVARRGRVIVRDADLLEALADGSYGEAEREAERLLPNPAF